MPSENLSTDWIEAFVQLAREGNLRKAAETLFISEQGLRNRLLTLETRLGAELYRKSRGRRAATPLTPQGREFLPHAIAYLERSERVANIFRTVNAEREIHVVASQYLIAYELIDAVRAFQKAFPLIRVRLSSRSEADIEASLQDDPDIAFGVVAPYEASPQLVYQHLFSMPWSVIAPPRHPILRKRGRVQLSDVVKHPVIFFERGSTGRQHVAEALRSRQLRADVELEATNTDLIVRMVEAGLGISIVPLHPSGKVTRGHAVRSRQLGEQVRQIDSGILLRRGEERSPEAEAFLNYIKRAHAGPTRRRT